MRLLPREALLKTGPVDHADWNYKPILGSIQRLRFKLALELIQEKRYRRILEIGYGSGVFMPELSLYCGELFGVDVHDYAPAVMACLSKNGVNASLHSAGAESLPFEDEFFDCVVAVSSLEFVSDLEQVCQEVSRVLTPEGRLIVITPGSSKILDLGLKVLTGKDAKADFGERRSLVTPALEKWFTLGVSRKGPGGLYQALDCRMKEVVSETAEAPVEHEEVEVERPATQSAPVFRIDQGPLRRSVKRSTIVRPVAAVGEHLIGDLNRGTKEDLERAILAVRRRRHTAVVQTSEQQQQQRKESA